MTDQSHRTYAVVTISDRSFRGERDDTSGPTVVAELTKALGVAPVDTRVIPDDNPTIQETLIDLCDRLQCRLVVTTGGTGLSERDVTPEATRAVLAREIPGMAEAMRAGTMVKTPFACLSRGVCGQRGVSIIINLPGSPKAAQEHLAILLPVLPHAMDVAAGNVTDCKT